MKDTEIKNQVRESYAKVARQERSCCDSSSSCCSNAGNVNLISKTIGYTEEEINDVPEGANLGLGCGNPLALASLKPGETVIDLGSGAGFDCFLAAKQVGETGSVIGIDMTPEMVDKARENSRKGNYSNVEFRLGEIENLPAADNIADIVISNCVINLAPDKKRVFQEALRVLKPGGRLMVSDIVLTKALPEAVTNSIQAYVGCVAGASVKSDYLSAIEATGFRDINVVDESPFSTDCLSGDPTASAIIESLNMSPETLMELAGTIRSVKVSAVKPG